MVPRVWGWKYGLLQIFVVVLSSAFAADNLYRLVPPEVYTVLSGDLEVTYEIPPGVSLPNAYVRLQGRRPRDERWVEITTMGLPLSSTSGSLKAVCGVLEFAGSYTLTLFLQTDGPVLAEASFIATWPAVTLRLPKDSFALTSPVSLEITSRAVCPSRLHRETMTLELYFRRFTQTADGSVFSELSEPRLVLAENFTKIEQKEQKWLYRCGVFDLDGSYHALLRSSSGTTLAVSNVMTTTFSASYHLTLRRSDLSIFPCPEPSGYLDIMYTYPPCANPDMFRVYRLVRRVQGSAASPLDTDYLGEFDVQPDQIHYRFNCSLFQKHNRSGGKVESSISRGQREEMQEREERGLAEREAMGFCFAYVTRSQFTVMTEQRRLCLPAQPNAILPQDGGWSSWTTWTTCSVTCGSGKRSRFRMCSSPAPKPGGQFCRGWPVQHEDCDVTCPDVIPRSPLRSPTFDPSCFCGCTRSDAQAGEIIASGRCAGLATWIIKSAPGHRVSLSFRFYDVMPERQWLKIRDGELETDDLLFASKDREQPSDVTSSAHVLRLEFMTQTSVTSPSELSVFPLNATLPIHVRGFIASYSVSELSRAEVPPPLIRHVETSILESEVTIVGISLCGVVVAAVVVFVVVQRVYWRQTPKYSAAQEEESPRHMVHSSSAQSSQPSSPGPQVQVDMDIPLTGRTRRKSSSGQPRQSRTSSISSTCSQTLKKMRGRQDNGQVGGTGSPKLSAKVYTNLGSPYAEGKTVVEVVVLPRPEDMVPSNSEAASFFPRNSPILRQVAPRSPKVHPHRFRTPSSTLAHSPTSASTVSVPGEPASHSGTKEDLLTRKRQERKEATDDAGGRGLGLGLRGEDVEEREVTGSSGGSGSLSSRPTFAYPSLTTTAASATTITKAEINLTKPSSVAMPPLSAKGLRSLDEPKPGLGKRLMWSPAEPKAQPLSKMASSGKRRSQEEAKMSSRVQEEVIPLIDSAEDTAHSTPQHLPSSSFAQTKQTASSGHAGEVETSFIMAQQQEHARTKARRPTSLTQTFSLDTTSSQGSNRVSGSKVPPSPAASSPPRVAGRSPAMEERQTLLPRPDGQSPKSHRVEHVAKTPTGQDKSKQKESIVDEEEEDKSKDSKSTRSSSSSPSKSSLGGKSSKTLSPTRSIATPELEYDDFIMDDPLSYFEYDDLSRMNWSGTEKLGHSHRHESRDDET